MPATTSSRPHGNLITSPTSELSTFDAEVVIIGAGPAGAPLAYSLSQSGRRVLLIERDLSPPDRIVGELLQPGGVNALKMLGMDDCLEGHGVDGLGENGVDAVRVEGYCVYMGGRVVGIPYPQEPTLERSDKGQDGEGGNRATKDSSSSNGYPDEKEKTNANGYADDDEKSPLVVSEPSSTDVVLSKSGRKEGRSFHHGRFVHALRQKAIHAPGDNLRVLEATAKSLLTCGHTSRVIGVSVAIKSPSTHLAEPGTGPDGSASSTTTTTTTMNIYAPLTIVADGCFSRFRTVHSGNTTPIPVDPHGDEGDLLDPSSSSSSAASPSDPASVVQQLAKSLKNPIANITTKSHFVGLILKDVKLPKPRHGTVCLTPQGPVLLYQIADRENETRMLVDVKGKLPSVGDGSLKSHIESAYLPHLPPTCVPAIQDALDTSRLRVMPNSYLPPKMQGRRGAREGVIMVGDSWNMRHPLTGGGMTVALHDAVLLTEYLRPSEELEDLGNWETIRHRLQEWHWRRKRLASVVNILSIALYDLFGADDENLAVLREGCFKYFELGGECVAGPVGLLSALTPKPLLLFYHFFAVAFYSIYILFTQGVPSADGKPSAPPSIARYPALTVQSFQVFWTACVVILPVIWSEAKV